MRNINFVIGEFYHIYNRGVEKRPIFFDDRDRRVFIQQISEFNRIDTQSNVPVSKRKIALQQYPNPLVRIHAYCLMDNHFHFLVEQVAEHGASKYMQKVGLGYTRYFNQKHGRSGSLFESTFKAKHIDSTQYLLHLSRYIHLNPLDIFDRSWRHVGVANESIVSDFLEKYPWSSYTDYIGCSNNPFVSTHFLNQGFVGADDYKRFVLEWTYKDLIILKNGLFDLW